MNTNNPHDEHATFAALLQAAINEPGKIHEAFHAFHSYSIGNQILAFIQCQQRGVQPGPLATFRRWKERGRHVRKGEKAIELVMPVTVKRTIDHEQEEPEQIAFTRFLHRRNWFVLAQTDGANTHPNRCRRGIAHAHFEGSALSRSRSIIWTAIRGGSHVASRSRYRRSRPCPIGRCSTRSRMWCSDTRPKASSRTDRGHPEACAKSKPKVWRYSVRLLST